MRQFCERLTVQPELLRASCCKPLTAFHHIHSSRNRNSLNKVQAFPSAPRSRGPRCEPYCEPRKCHEDRSKQCRDLGLWTDCECGILLFHPEISTSVLKGLVKFDARLESRAVGKYFAMMPRFDYRLASSQRQCPLHF